MKKIIILLILVLFVGMLTLYNLLQDKYLLETESINFNDIKYITIKDDNKQDIKITSKEDYSFLQGYYYTNDFDSSRMPELDLSSTRKVCIVSNKNDSLLILRTGEIVIKPTGNSKYQIYKTSDAPMYSDEINTLLKKYSGNVQ